MPITTRAQTVSTQRRKLVAMYNCLSEKTMRLMRSICSSTAAAVAVGQLQLELDQLQAFCSQKCDF